MFTITTAEIRWFLPGHPDENLATWLRGLDGTFEEQEPRNDLYLLFQGQVVFSTGGVWIQSSQNAIAYAIGDFFTGSFQLFIQEVN